MFVNRQIKFIGAICFLLITFNLSLAVDEAALEPEIAMLPLQGEWICRLDPEDVGINEAWFAGPLGGKASKVWLPGSTTTNKLGEEIKRYDKRTTNPNTPLYWSGMVPAYDYYSSRLVRTLC